MTGIDGCAGHVRTAMDDVNARFARSLDTGEYQSLQELFTPDSLYRSGDRSLRGIEEIVRSFHDRNDGSRVTRHTFSGLHIRQLSADTASTVSVWTCQAAAAPGADFGVFMVADFHDEWQLDDQRRWRISSRTIVPVFRNAQFAPVGDGTPSVDPPRTPGRPRTNVPRRSEMNTAQQALYDVIVGGPRQSQRGQIPLTDDAGGLLGPFGLMTISPEVGARVQELGAALRFRSNLSDRARELLILDIAARARCEFEWFAHEKAAEAAGLSAAQRQALLDGKTPDGLTVDEYSILELSRALTAGSLSDQKFADLSSILGAAVMTDVVWTTGYYRMLAWALDLFRPASSSADRGPVL